MDFRISVLNDFIDVLLVDVISGTSVIEVPSNLVAFDIDLYTFDDQGGSTISWKIERISEQVSERIPIDSGVMAIYPLYVFAGLRLLEASLVNAF